MLVPRANMVPGVWLAVKEARLQLSVAVGSVQLTVASQVRGSADTVISGGQLLITGSVISSTVIIIWTIHVP